MASDPLSQRTAQLDTTEREHLEDVVTEMRERVEDNVEFQLTQKGLDDEPEDVDSLDEDTQQLVEAIDLEAAAGDSWSEAFDQYVTGVGYTNVNRLAALRCMEVRAFIDEEVTVFKANGLTPAAETLVHEEFFLEDEAILEAYHNACDDLAAEIEILFDRSSAYSLIDLGDDTFEALCEKLDSVPDEVWRADDVLGWVYEYYNVKLLDDLRKKGTYQGLDPKDVPPANQFYTPHWVVRMLTDNSLGKLYLEQSGDLDAAIEAQEEFATDERKNRPLPPEETPAIADFCTYLVPSEAGEPTEFDHPKELRVIDPACGSGHFLLYAFDILERIWRIETDLDGEAIPRKILQHNLYGVDLDMRACQLAAFNLYLKGRSRVEAEGADSFEMPEMGIVCADATIAEVDGVDAVFEEVAGDDEEIQHALERILGAFEEVHGLGSLLDVRGTLGALFEDDADTGGTQLTLGDDPRQSHTLGQVLHSLREAVEEQREVNSFLAQDLRSFVRLLDILAQEYDVALMNPPYGSQNRMPDSVEDYVDEQYSFGPEFYINFYEACEELSTANGRIGMLVPRTFMFNSSLQDFRESLLDKSAGIDFLAEYGLGVLDNATVRTVGTVVRSDAETATETAGQFIRLHDVESHLKEEKYVTNVLHPDSAEDDGVQRYFSVSMSEFRKVPGSPLSYYTPDAIRSLHETDLKIDAERARIPGENVADAVQGLSSGNNDRFHRHHWETSSVSGYRPIARGGADAWVLPRITQTAYWNGGEEIKRTSGSLIRNEPYYGREGLTWTYMKETGRRFGYFPEDGLFDYAGSMLFPRDGRSLWSMLSVLNSDLYHALMLSITVERNWNVGGLGRLPWNQSVADNGALAAYAKEQYQLMREIHSRNPTSPYYTGPSLLPSGTGEKQYYQHPHTTSHSDVPAADDSIRPSNTVQQAAHEWEGERLRLRTRLEELAAKIDEAVFDLFAIGPRTRETARQEIFLRTAESPENREVTDPASLPEVPESIDQQVKDLVHHFAMAAVREESDGVIPVRAAGNQADMLDHIVERFTRTYGEYAEDRLVEVDDVLGTESAAEEAYPNLQSFIADELFDYHVDRMENTPIVWKLTTKRLLADSTGEGFACFLNYHGIGPELFDRLSNQYLEPRKAELRERRSAANRRRSDDSLSASEQAEAAEQYEQCASGLNQISAFEDVVQALSSSNEREFGDENRALAEELAPKVAAFREETRERTATLAALHEHKGEAWFKDTFSDKFWETVDERCDEWLDALAELEDACEAYTKPTDEPVEAHLADLFDYFSARLKGSDHYSSSGILFMTYYFEREGSDLLDENGQPHDHLSEDERRLASVATGLEQVSIVDEAYLNAAAADAGVDETAALPPLTEFKALAEEIDDRCQTLGKRVPSDWADRALSEITTTGYQPNHKHGVEINITPLADAEIVPKSVDEEVV